MWPRYVELLIGLWMVVAPWALPGDQGVPHRSVDLGAGVSIIAFAALSFGRFPRAHYLSALAAALLGAFGYLAGDGSRSPAAQNEIVMALLLSMFFFLPNNASAPSPSWRSLSGQG
ncbi:MAG: hypothetical protein IT168_24170 [Bryobacterales bacterium]|nr:hypothetical protein [Bryobacterales bacterium]